MTSTIGRAGSATLAFSVVVALQAIAAVFFVADVIDDLLTEEVGLHIAMEGVSAIALLAGVVLGARHIRMLLEDARQREEILAVAAGALGNLIQRRFAEWGLTPAEADVAFLALKGCDTAQIADVRKAAQGTVRAQLARVYAKSGVTSRAELISHFFEDLLDGCLAPGSGNAG